MTDVHYDGGLCRESCQCVNRKLERAEAALTESQADRARLREWGERLARVIRNPACGSCQNVSAEAAMLLDATDTPNPLLEELRTLRAEVEMRKTSALCSWCGTPCRAPDEILEHIKTCAARKDATETENNQLRARVAELEGALSKSPAEWCLSERAEGKGGCGACSVYCADLKAKLSEAEATVRELEEAQVIYKAEKVRAEEAATLAHRERVNALAALSEVETAARVARLSDRERDELADAKRALSEAEYHVGNYARQLPELLKAREAMRIEANEEFAKRVTLEGKLSEAEARRAAELRQVAEAVRDFSFDSLQGRIPTSADLDAIIAGVKKSS